VRKAGAFILVVIMVFLGLHFTQASTAASPPKLSQVVYITLSKACGCMKEKCQAGDGVVDKVFGGEKQALLKRIDYSTDKEGAREYIKKYRLTMPPSLLFLDSQGNLLWRADGDLDYDAVVAKLKEFGA